MTVPTPLAVLPLVVTLGSQDGHRLELLSAELWDTWWDLRFARVDVEGAAALPRRVPPADAWEVGDDLGTVYEVVDAVGRGDRAFSNGEVRLRPTLAADARLLRVAVSLTGQGRITAEVPLPAR